MDLGGLVEALWDSAVEEERTRKLLTELYDRLGGKAYLASKARESISGVAEGSTVPGVAIANEKKGDGHQPVKLYGVHLENGTEQLEPEEPSSREVEEEDSGEEEDSDDASESSLTGEDEGEMGAEVVGDDLANESDDAMSEGGEQLEQEGGSDVEMAGGEDERKEKGDDEDDDDEEDGEDEDDDEVCLFFPCVHAYIPQ